MVEDKLSELLLQLTKAVEKIVKEEKEKDAIKYRKSIHLIDEITQFKYDTKTGGISMSYSPKEEIEEKIDVFYLHELHESKIQTLSEFSQISVIMAKIKNVNTNQSDYWLSNFTNSLVEKIADGEDKDKLTLFTITFLRQLEGGVINWHPIVWLDGILMPDKEVIVNENLMLKQPTKEDVKERRDLSFNPHIIGDHVSCILLPYFQTKGVGESQRKIESIVTVLQLFRVGSVMSTRTKWKSDAIMGLTGTTSFSSQHHVATYKYPITTADGTKLNEFIDNIGKLLPKEIIQRGSSEVDYLVIAIQRYQDALLKPEIAESRLSFAVMCLEALYLKENERQELDHRLSQRVAKILGQFDHETLKVYNDIRRSYSIRSNFVHGSPVSQDEQNEAIKLAQDILEYARLSIVLQLQIKSKIKKDDFLNLVDKSLLNNEESKKLKKLIDENCKMI